MIKNFFSTVGWLLIGLGGLLAGIAAIALSVAVPVLACVCIYYLACR